MSKKKAAYENPLIPNARLQQMYRAILRAHLLGRALPPTQRALTSITASELQEHLIAGQFPTGNMGPKIESVLRFLRDGGKEAIITSAENLSKAVRGDAGTHILPDEPDINKTRTVPDEVFMGRR